MSITDELREYAHDCCARIDDDIHAIADRIDAEHEQQCAESWMRGHDAWAAIDRSDEMAEHGWIRLPKDADGEYIRVGDVMRLGSVERDLTVLGFGVPDASGHDYGVYVLDGDEYTWYNAIFLRHYHAPTVEDVLREFALAVCKDDALTIRKGVVEEYAKRLKLAEGEDA